MPTPWLGRIKKSGQLTVFNKAGAWTDSVNAAIAIFNTLPFSVQLVAAKEEKSANIVVLLANGPQQYTRDGDTVQTGSSFRLDYLHGQTSTLADDRTREIFFAAIFLPGKVPKPTKGQKEVIIVHEFIHACGVPEHESVGIMFGQMLETDGKLIEYLHDETAKPMPPLRVGPQTLCRMQSVWSDAEACKNK